MSGAFDDFLASAASDCVNADHGQGAPARAVPSPKAPLPSLILIALSATLREAALDIAMQARAALDREEVELKLDYMERVIAETRIEYLAAIDGR